MGQFGFQNLMVESNLVDSESFTMGDLMAIWHTSLIKAAGSRTNTRNLNLA